MRCMTCSASGWIRKEVPSELYECGTAVVASRCWRCGGSGKVILPPPEQERYV